MAALADRLARIAIQVTSPDANVRVRYRDGRLDAVEFRPGTYERYTEPALERQLAEAMTLLFRTREDAVGKVVTEAGLRRYSDPAEAVDEAQRRYLQRVYALDVVGTGPAEHVRFKARSLQDWHCRIERGTLRRLDEAAFRDEATAAAADVVRRSHHEVRLLKDECYDLRVPALKRERERREVAISRGEPHPYTSDAW